MKKSPFGAIPYPSMPTTLSGQWLTYSHMTNHYRRLLNVKPRVDSCAPKNVSSSTSKFNLFVLKKRKPKRKSESKESIESNDEICRGRSKRVPEIKLEEKDSNCYSDNSAFLSEERESSDEYYEKSIGIGEKIQFFLDQINTPEKESRGPNKAQKESKNMTLRKSASAYATYECSTNPPVKRSALSHTTLTRKNSMHQPKRKQRGIFTSTHYPEPERLIKCAKPPMESPYNMSSSKMRIESPGSLGTIKGSDDLQDLGYSEKLIFGEERRIRRGIASSPNLQMNTSTNTPSPSSQQNPPLQNGSTPKKNGNKESSHDSAYGFSSNTGSESKITTRESTPEKAANKKKRVRSRENEKFKSTLSTVASSINQDVSTRGAQSQSFGNSWMREQKYVNFVAEVTEDIVRRGIFTNKGLKGLFKAHSERHPELETEKLTKLLDKLRLDVGVPKEDALNHLEFGFGSINHSVEPFFYKKTAESVPSTASLLNSGGNRKSVADKDKEIDPEKYYESSSSSNGQSKNPPLLRDSETATEITVIRNRGNASSSRRNLREQRFSTSGTEEEANASREGDSSISSEKSSDESILSEREIKQALKEIGLKEKSQREIMEIITKCNNPRSHKSKSYDF